MTPTAARSVLIASANPEDAEHLAQFFQEGGYHTATCSSQNRYLSFLRKGPAPDVAILDTRQANPLLSPWEAFQRGQDLVRIPHILLVEDGRAAQQALEAGADDAVVAPFHLPELLARVHAILRRRPGQVASRERDLYLDRDLLIDFETHEVWVRGQVVPFTPQEYALLETLARHTGQVLSHGQLVWLAWQEPTPTARRPVLKQYIWRLRQKIEEDPHNPQIIVTHHGQGYEWRRLWDE